MAEGDIPAPGALEGAFDHFLVIHRHIYRLALYRRTTKTSTRFYRVFAAPIAIGMIGYQTPGGMFLIRRKARNPEWLAPDAPWVPEEIRGKVFAGDDPENPIKEAFLDIWNGVGIHGTDDLASLGTQASHGCIRVTRETAHQLYHLVPVLTPCFIT